MLTISYPWIALLLAAPLVLRRLLPSYREPRAAVRVPFVERVLRLTGSHATGKDAVYRARLVQKWMQWSCWTCLVLAACRPQWLEPPVTKIIPVRNLMLAVDLSGSMDTTDFTDASGHKIDRLSAVKQVLAKFLAQRKSDRVGLIFFGSSPFLQAPFTEDLSACQQLLDEARVGMCGPKTALADAIGLAMQTFERSDTKERVLIALTDGNDTASQIPPSQAAEIARDHHVTVYCVGVGDPRAAGEEKFDEATLKQLAQITGGEYFHAGDRGQLASIYQQLDKLEPQKVETISQRPTRDLFYLPLAVFLAISLTYHVAALSRASWDEHLATSASATTAPLIATAGALVLSAWKDFHFLRPWWLLAFVPAAAVVLWASRRHDPWRGWRTAIAAPLLDHLMLAAPEHRRWRPLGLLAAVWLLTVVALAGPTWRREPAPFAKDESALVIAVQCTPSMLGRDVQPSRLARAAEKIHDLLAQRPGARTALIAYSGDAHLVMPLTSDASAIDYFAAALSPDIMPREGDNASAAVQLAGSLLAKAGQSGSILLVTDRVSPAQVQALEARDKKSAPVNVLAVGAEKPVPVAGDGPIAAPISRAPLAALAAKLSGKLIVVTADESDVTQLARAVQTQWVAAGDHQHGERWQDAGYWLTPLLLVASIAWFRPGWLVTYD